QPVAYWNDGELLNVRGEAFKAGPVTRLGNLPNLAGPQGSGSEVLAEMDALQSQLGGLGLNVSQLRLEPRGAWRFQVNDTVWVMLGRNDREARLARFMAAWQRRLSDEASQIRYIDLRYPNGVAVAWHGETTALENGQEG
ncbi:MAG: cell division protein FtsQ/DivIB, partial [Cobetia crustatorum]